MGNLFGGGEKKPDPIPKAPVTPVTPPAPEPDDSAVRKAKKKSQQANTQRRGRVSTFLSEDTGGAKETVS